MTSIFVGNLPYDTSEEEIRRVFESFGRVTSVSIMTDQATHRSRGFGFVRMPSLDDADEAIRRLAGFAMKGRRLTVNESEDCPKPKGDVHDRRARSSALQMFDLLCSES